MSADLENAKLCFAQVRFGLEVDKSSNLCVNSFPQMLLIFFLYLFQVEWLLAVQTFRACIPVISQPETQDFLDSLFIKMIDFLTSQK